MSSLQEAERLAREHPCWLVVYGAWTHELVVFPKFKVPPGTWFHAQRADLLIPRMRRIETLAKAAAGIQRLL